MFKLVQRKDIVLNPKTATNILKCNNYIDQRRLDQKSVNVLRKAIKEGVFLTGHVALARCNYNGSKVVMVNGQHQCHAVIDEGATVTVAKEDYSCESPEDLALLYRQFDNHKARSITDGAKPEATSLGIEWPMRVVTLVIAAASILDNKTRYNKNERIPLLRLYLREGSFVASILCPDNKLHEASLHIARSSVIAIMMRTWRKNQSEAELFWNQVRDGENLKKHMAVYKLRDWLTRIKVNGNARSRTPVERGGASNHEVMAKCITAWNAYRRNLTTDLKYYADKDLPRLI